MSNNETSGLAKRVEYISGSGVPLLVEMLSPYTSILISQKAWGLYPNPPEEAYRLPFPESAIENDYKPASDNPEWQKLAAEAATKRSNYIVQQHILLSVEPKSTSREALVEQYASRLEQLERVIDLPENRWDAVLLHCICTDRLDPDNIWQIATGRAQLTEAEIHESFRLFRVVVPGATAGRVDGEASSVSPGSESKS